MNNYEGKRLFGNWYIPDFKKPIGVGSFGTVYELRSYDAKNSVTAVKIISIPRNNEEYEAALRAGGATESEVQDRFEKTKENLIQEVEMMLKVSGFTNCVGCMSYFVEAHEDSFGWDILIQMELLESLNDYFKGKGTITNFDIVRMGINICSALEVCEANKIIHRDIKPANIMVKDINGTAFYKLGDFGVARLLSDSGTMTVSGTLDYMAPELLRGEGDLRVDIYSLGIVMYQLLNANRIPFMPDYPLPVDKNAEDKARQKRLSGEKMPEALYTCGTKLAQVILKACEYDKNLRYASPAEMKKELEAVLAEEKEWPVFSVTEIGKYVPSERKAIVKISGAKEKLTYDGKEHTVSGYTSNVSNGSIKIELKPKATAQAKGTKPGKYSMGLTADSFIVTSADANLSVAEIVVDDGYVEIEKTFKRKPWVIAVFAVAAIALICAVLGGKKKPVETSAATEIVWPTVNISVNETEDENAAKLLLTLTPGDDAGYADVNHDTPILLERLKALCPDVKAEANKETGVITAEMPLDAVGAENDVPTVLRAAVNRPMKLYFVKWEDAYHYHYYYEEEATINSDDIVEIRSITAAEAEREYGMPLTYGEKYSVTSISKEQPCVLMKLTEECAAKAVLGDLANEGIFSIATDIAMQNMVYFPFVYQDEDGVTFIAVPSSWSEQSIVDALVYGYSHEKLNKSYYFDYEVTPIAYWEHEDTADNYGEKQCEYEALTGDTVRLKLKCSNTAELTDEIYNTLMDTLKDELDIIGSPYAIGAAALGDKAIMVATDPSKLSLALLKIFNMTSISYDVGMVQLESPVWRLKAKSMDIVQNDDGTYALAVEFTDADLLKNITSELFRKSVDKNIYIELGGYASYILAATPTDVVYDGKLLFTSSPVVMKDNITDEYKYLLEIVKYVFESDYLDYLRCYYTVEEYVFSNDDGGFGISTVTEEEQSIANNINELHPEIRVSVSDGGTDSNLWIYLNATVEAGFLEKAFDLTETIFNENDLDNSTFGCIYFIILDEVNDTRCRLVFQPYTGSYYMSCTGLCSGDWLDVYSAEFEKEALSRYFFSKRPFAMFS